MEVDAGGEKSNDDQHAKQSTTTRTWIRGVTHHDGKPYHRAPQRGPDFRRLKAKSAPASLLKRALKHKMDGAAMLPRPFTFENDMRADARVPRPYFANGVGRIWNFTAFGNVPLPPSMCHDAYVE